MVMKFNNCAIKLLILIPLKVGKEVVDIFLKIPLSFSEDNLFQCSFLWKGNSLQSFDHFFEKVNIPNVIMYLTVTLAVSSKIPALWAGV
jgi:hypothetical protein